MLLATSLADCTKCRLATGLAVLEDARRHVLHSDAVLLAMVVAADNIWQKPGKNQDQLCCVIALVEYQMSV